jgi:hypothetical protein
MRIKNFHPIVRFKLVDNQPVIVTKIYTSI